MEAKKKDIRHDPPAPPNPVAPLAEGVTTFADDPEMMTAFLVEAREHLDNVEQRMLLLEKNPKDLDAIHTVFRAFHTIKGLAAFLDLEGVRSLTHEIETLLNEARNSRLEIGPEIADVILQGADRVNVSLRALDRGVCERTAPELAVDESLINRIRRLLTAGSGSATQELAGAEDGTGSKVAEPASGSTPPTEEVTQNATLAAEALTIKVATSKLDYLVEMVGEMITAASVIRADPSFAPAAHSTLGANLTRLSMLIGEVQKTSMSMRMVPMGSLFQRLTRVARDLSRKAEKPVEFQIKGEDTELDRNIVEGLHDPLMHMIRNSIDHGIEDGATRAALGKNRVATIELSAAHQAGYIVVRISDDGRGMDPEKLRKRAIEGGFADEDVTLTHEDCYNLVFLPGFSTAAAVTSISGRGVGMDVVRRHIQKLRGRIEIQSKVGEGTVFTLKLPLTLAVVTGLIIRVATNRYIIPTFSVTQVLRGRDVTIRTIEGKGEVALVRGDLYPLVRLHRRFNVGGACEDPAEALMVITDSDSGSYCLMADQLVGQQEVVIKNLGEGMQQVRGIAGGAILGDGTVGLILDAAQIPEWSARDEL